MKLNRLPYFKLGLSVILRAIADSDVRFARHDDGHNGKQQQISDDAKQFIASTDFKAWCLAIGLSPARLRRVRPSVAASALEILGKDGKAYRKLKRQIALLQHANERRERDRIVEERMASMRLAAREFDASLYIPDDKVVS